MNQPVSSGEKISEAHILENKLTNVIWGEKIKRKEMNCERKRKEEEDKEKSYVESVKCKRRGEYSLVSREGEQHFLRCREN
jgi:hypothetical protein